MASQVTDEGRESVESACGNPEDECLKRVRVLTDAILELIPVKSESLKVEDRKKIRGWVHELNQLFGEQRGIVREVRASAERETTAVPNFNSASVKQTYAEKLKRNTVTVQIEPKTKQSSEETKKELTTKVDVVAKQIGVRGVKKGKDGKVLVECSSKKDAEKLQVSVAESMQAKAREVKKNNPVVCIYGVDEELTSGQIAECVRQQNETIASNYKSADELEKELKVFRFFATPKDKKRGVKNAVCSVSPKLRSAIVNGKLKIMWRVCTARDYNNVLYCFKCLKVGHRAKECKGETACKKCGGNHDRSDCKSAEIKCVVCQRTKIPGLDVKHEAYSSSCHSLKRLLEEEKKRTNY